MSEGSLWQRGLSCDEWYKHRKCCTKIKKITQNKCNKHQSQILFSPIYLPGISEGIPRYSHWLFRTRAGNLHHCRRCGNGSKGSGTSCDLRQDLEGERPRGVPGALRAGRAGPSHPTCGGCDGISCQADVTLREELPWQGQFDWV